MAAPLMAEEDGWISLFNGEDLIGLEGQRKPIVSHELRTDCWSCTVQGLTRFTSVKMETPKFKNFHLKTEVMTKPKANSGIYFHTKYLDTWMARSRLRSSGQQQPWRPEEDRWLVQRQGQLRSAVAKDNEWFTYEIIVDGKHIVVKIDGKTITDYTEPDDLNRPDRQLSSGRIALQAHDPGSKVLYRNLKIKRLPDA